MNVFTLKMIALAAMLIDHIGAVTPGPFGEGLNFLRVIGRVAFPIFVYLIAEGFRHTKSPVKYLARLGVFAVISEVPYDLAFGRDVGFFMSTNIFYTLFLGGAAIFVFQKFEKFHHGAYLAVLPFMWLTDFFDSDYGEYGVLFIFLMYVITNMQWRLAVMTVLCAWQHEWIIRRLLLELLPPVTALELLAVFATMLPALLFVFYNGKRGPKLKWFFYVFYPAHLLVLSLLVVAA